MCSSGQKGKSTNCLAPSEFQWKECDARVIPPLLPPRTGPGRIFGPTMCRLLCFILQKEWTWTASKPVTHPVGDKDLDSSLDLNPQLSLALGHSSIFRGKEVGCQKGAAVSCSCYCEGIRFFLRPQPCDRTQQEDNLTSFYS